MNRLRAYLRSYPSKPMVRPLALAGPILVLLVALPLLRPLRHPNEISNDEMLRLASIRALVEHRSLSLGRAYALVPGVVRTGSGVYSAQPPMMAVLLSAPAWVMTRMGLSFEQNQVLIAYMLTLLGVTLPVAGAAGLIYRMGRLFELPRPWRTGLGIAVVFGSGLISYSVVLNPHAPGAALILGSAACLIHVAVMNRRDRRAGWFALAGACGALAATLDPAAAVLLVLFIFVIAAMKFSLWQRLAGAMLYILGATPVISLHTAWNVPITGDMVPASVHVAMSDRPIVSPVVAIRQELDDEERAAQPTVWTAIGSHLLWTWRATLGNHGVLSHFPMMLLGILGIGAVMHRHWPDSTKILAAATALGAIVIIVLYRIARLDWAQAMFATRWFIVFLPMLLFWAGAWMRRRHTPGAWSVAGVLTAFSIAVGLLGATHPYPRHGFDRYTAAGALMRLMSAQTTVEGGIVAGR